MGDKTIGVISVSTVCTISDAGDGSNVSSNSVVVTSVCTICAPSDEVIIIAAEGSSVSGNTVVVISDCVVCAASIEVNVVAAGGFKVSESSVVGGGGVSVPTVCNALEMSDKNGVENETVNVVLSNCCISEGLSVTVTVRLYTFISAEVVDI